MSKKAVFMWVFERPEGWRCGICFQFPEFRQVRAPFATESEALELGRDVAQRAADEDGFTTYLYRSDPEETAPPESWAEIIRPAQGR